MTVAGLCFGELLTRCRFHSRHKANVLETQCMSVISFLMRWIEQILENCRDRHTWQPRCRRRRYRTQAKIKKHFHCTAFFMLLFLNIWGENVQHARSKMKWLIRSRKERKNLPCGVVIRHWILLYHLSNSSSVMWLIYNNFTTQGCLMKFRFHSLYATSTAVIYIYF